MVFQMPSTLNKEESKEISVSKVMTVLSWGCFFFFKSHLNATLGTGGGFGITVSLR